MIIHVPVILRMVMLCRSPSSKPSLMSFIVYYYKYFSVLSPVLHALLEQYPAPNSDVQRQMSCPEPRNNSTSIQIE